MVTFVRLPRYSWKPGIDHDWPVGENLKLATLAQFWANGLKHFLMVLYLFKSMGHSELYQDRSQEPHMATSGPGLKCVFCQFWINL